MEATRIPPEPSAQIPGLQGVRLKTKEKVDPNSGERVFIVWEIYDEQISSADIPLVRVQMEPTPTRSAHEIMAETRRVRHEFRYPGGAISPPPQLLVTTKESICAEADIVVTDKPIEVTAPRQVQH